VSRTKGQKKEGRRKETKAMTELYVDVMLSDGSASQPVTQEEGQRWMTEYGLTAFTAHSL